MTTKRRRPKAAITAEFRAEFDRLAAQWKHDTRFHSSSTIIEEHPAYQAIIAMGQDAIPLILADLQQSMDHWFMALRSITGESPVRYEDRGKVSAMTESWLLWGRQHGYIAE